MRGFASATLTARFLAAAYPMPGINDVGGRPLNLAEPVGGLLNKTIFGGVGGGDTIAMRFQDGGVEVFDNLNVSARYSPADYNIRVPHIVLDYSFKSPVNPWFTHHETPQAGVFWDYTSGTFTFYVSYAT
jgi:hypothetical protein